MLRTTDGLAPELLVLLGEIGMGVQVTAGFVQWRFF
jgi:hypothetical protein